MEEGRSLHSVVLHSAARCGFPRSCEVIVRAAVRNVDVDDAATAAAGDDDERAGFTPFIRLSPFSLSLFCAEHLLSGMVRCNFSAIPSSLLVSISPLSRHLILDLVFIFLTEVPRIITQIVINQVRVHVNKFHIPMRCVRARFRKTRRPPQDSGQRKMNEHQPTASNPETEATLQSEALHTVVEHAMKYRGGNLKAFLAIR